ncbi:MAG: ABC transporter permease, partial [Aurantimicrobium sp.]
MFFTYLRRELSGRRKQTAIIASGMALAIALVIIVNSVAAGVKSAQSKVLESVYGVGTDISV